jgi:G:T-mismatch repair DNA endonuclease (very short patch repair protein)
VVVLLSIVVVWLLVGVAWLAAFWRVGRRPLSDTDHWCARIDRALLRDYGSPLHRVH